MKKRAIIIGAIVLIFAAITITFCTNLFGYRTMMINWINHMRWDSDCESISVKAALHAIMKNTQGIDILDEIVFPKEAYVDAYNASSHTVTAKSHIIRRDAHYPYDDEASTNYEVHISLPKEQTAAFINALLSAGFTEEYRAQTGNQWDMYIPQTFGALSNDQLSYVFERLYIIEHPSSDGYEQRPTAGFARIYLVESEKITEVIINI